MLFFTNQYTFYLEYNPLIKEKYVIFFNPKNIFSYETFKTNVQNLFYFLFLSVVLLSCEKDDLLSDFDSFAESSKRTLSKDIPFTTENMQKAYDNLMENTTAASFMTGGTLTKNGGVTIQPSHYYYRFLPSDSLEFAQLNQDTILEISETPLGLNVSIDMDSLYLALDTTNQYPYCYSVFPVGHNFPSNIASIKLGEFYFPPEDSSSNIKSGGNNGKLAMDNTSKNLQAEYGGQVFELIELEALKLTNNLHQDELDRLKFISPSNATTVLSYKEIEKKGYSIADLKIDYSQYGVEKFWGSKWRSTGRITVEEGVLTTLSSSNNIHELTHAGHRELDNGMFGLWSQNRTCNIMRECWAEGVEGIVTTDRYVTLSSNYLNFGNVNYGWNWGWQATSTDSLIARGNERTPLVMDLVDNVNQNIVFSSFSLAVLPVDNVNGYTLSQIQAALNNCRTLSCWENNLRNMFNNPTEGNLTPLFNETKAVRDAL